MVIIGKDIQVSRIIMSYFISAFSCFSFDFGFQIIKPTLLFPESFLVEKTGHLKELLILRKHSVPSLKTGSISIGIIQSFFVLRTYILNYLLGHCLIL